MDSVDACRFDVQAEVGDVGNGTPGVSSATARPQDVAAHGSRLAAISLPARCQPVRKRRLDDDRMRYLPAVAA